MVVENLQGKFSKLCFTFFSIEIGKDNLVICFLAVAVVGKHGPSKVHPIWWRKSCEPNDPSLIIMVFHVHFAEGILLWFFSFLIPKKKSHQKLTYLTWFLAEPAKTPLKTDTRWPCKLVASKVRFQASKPHCYVQHGNAFDSPPGGNLVKRGFTTSGGHSMGAPVICIYYIKYTLDI